MSEPIDLVLSRLDGFKLRPNGKDRWRACCPGHSGTNPSGLSIAIGDSGAVLLKCWSGCDTEQITVGLGLVMEDLFPPRDAHGAPLKRRRVITASQALDLLDQEANFVAVAAGNLAFGTALSEDDRTRLLKAAARISTLREECKA